MLKKCKRVPKKRKKKKETAQDAEDNFTIIIAITLKEVRENFASMRQAQEAIRGNS